MKSIQDHLDPELRGLLAEIALQPSSLLFGRSQVKPARWSGGERGLSNAEREVLRAHREAVGFGARQISLQYQVALAETNQPYDPEFSDRAATWIESQDLTVESEVQRLRSGLIEAGNGASRVSFLRALDLLTETPRDGVRSAERVLELLKEAIRIHDHPFTRQHAASWYVWSGQAAAARAVFPVAYVGSFDGSIEAALSRGSADIAHARSEWDLAAAKYLDSARILGPSTAWMLGLLNSVLSQTGDLVDDACNLFGGTRPSDKLISEAARFLKFVLAGEVKQQLLQRVATCPGSNRRLAADLVYSLVMP